MRAPIFFGRVVQGALKLDNRERFRSYLAGFEGKRIELILRERREERSEQQNAYYWAVVLAVLSDHIGDTPENIHEDLKVHFKVSTTTQLNKKDFNEYLEKVRRWAAQFHGVAIPDPNEVDF